MLEGSGVNAMLVTHDRDEALSFGRQVGVLADCRLGWAGAPVAVTRGGGVRDGTLG